MANIAKFSSQSQSDAAMFEAHFQTFEEPESGVALTARLSAFREELARRKLTGFVIPRASAQRLSLRARVKRASPESITTIGSMDSGPAPRGASSDVQLHIGE